jgi:hypothetical protein
MASRCWKTTARGAERKEGRMRTMDKCNGARNGTDDGRRGERRWEQVRETPDWNKLPQRSLHSPHRIEVHTKLSETPARFHKAPISTHGADIFHHGQLHHLPGIRAAIAAQNKGVRHSITTVLPKVVRGCGSMLHHTQEKRDQPLELHIPARLHEQVPTVLHSSAMPLSMSKRLSASL